MRVLVTGHHGYIGSLLMPLLARPGIDAVGLDSDLFDSCTFGPPVVEPWPSRRQDLRDVTVGDLEGFDAVMHLAALSNDPLGDINPNLTYDINLDGSLRLARLAKEAGVQRFLFSSSCSNYGASGDDLLDEQAALAPLTAYAVSKVKLEEELTRLARRHLHAGLPAQRHRLRHLAAPAGRSGAQQPDRLGGDHGEDRPAERRHPVAADRSRRGHLPRLPAAARGAARQGPRPGVQHRRLGGELPHPRARRDRRRDDPRLRGDLRAGGRARRPQLPRELRQARRTPSRSSA